MLVLALVLVLFLFLGWGLCCMRLVTVYDSDVGCCSWQLGERYVGSSNVKSSQVTIRDSSDTIGSKQVKQ